MHAMIMLVHILILKFSAIFKTALCANYFSLKQATQLLTESNAFKWT